ncbi:hypothetical protein EDB87DRAFT_241971 [Lactarius vividus]|nr:hypothetical protein EDB87DRAFT_241971 [Lactarius vividus]
MSSLPRLLGLANISCTYGTCLHTFATTHGPVTYCGITDRFGKALEPFGGVQFGYVTPWPIHSRRGYEDMVSSSSLTRLTELISMVPLYDSYNIRMKIL